MRRPLMLLVVAGCLVTGAHVAQAAPSCNLVTDATGDVDNAPAFPDDGGLDLVGADFASNAKSVTGLIKLASPVPSAGLYDRRWTLTFKPAGSANTLLLSLRQMGLTGELTYQFGYIPPDSTTYSFTGAATGKADGATITITAALSDMAADTNVGTVKPGVTVKELGALAFRRVNGVATGLLFQADDATSSKSYVAGSPSCLKVG